MIKNTESLSMAEAVEYVKKTDENAEVIAFIKKFNNSSAKDAKEIREKIRGFGNMKIKEEDISKIIDIMPDDMQDLNKIFTEVSLEEDEAKKILDTIKEYK